MMCDALWRFFREQFANTVPQVCHDDLSDGVLYLRLRRYGRGSDYVGKLPCWFFSMVRTSDDRVVGLCDLRVGWSEEIAYAGQIGYRVFKAYRGHGYAERASRLLLAFAARIDMEEILITCNPDNLPSRRTLERLDGRFSGIVQVPRGTPAWQAGDREKCQFYYHSSDYPLPLSPEDDAAEVEDETKENGDNA